MLCPQWGLDYTRVNSCHTDSKKSIKFGHGAYKAVDAMFCCRVDWDSKENTLSSNTGDVDGMLGFLGVTVMKEMGNDKLGGADGMNEVDINQGISVSSGRALTVQGARREIEATPFLYFYQFVGESMARPCMKHILVRTHQHPDTPGQFHQTLFLQP